MEVFVKERMGATQPDHVLQAGSGANGTLTLALRYVFPDRVVTT